MLRLVEVVERLRAREDGGADVYGTDKGDLPRAGRGNRGRYCPRRTVRRPFGL